MKYNWQQDDWPHFRYDISAIEDLLFRIAEKMGRVSGVLLALPENLQIDTMIALMVAEGVKTSEIEGEYLDRQDVMSSIRNNLGLNEKPEKIKDKRVQGIAKLMLDVRENFKLPLTKQMLFKWHELLLSEQSSLKSLALGQWRTHSEPMQIISMQGYKIKVHYEAPPSARVPLEMKKFLLWYNASAPGQANEIIHAPIRSAIGHLYFESIHPFEDGNGRIGRVIAEKALSQGFTYPLLLSLSQAIEAKKKIYYSELGKAQTGNEITAWIHYFVNTILLALTTTENQISFTLQKTKFFDRYKEKLNDRELKIIQRMLQEGPNGFMGGISAKKYMAITATSKATATRDLQHLLELGAIKQIGSGRATHYELNWES